MSKVMIGILTVIVLLFAGSAFAQTITNEDIEKRYGKSEQSSSDEDQAATIEQRREENRKALDSFNCTQLKAARTTNTAQYRGASINPNGGVKHTWIPTKRNSLDR